MNLQTCLQSQNQLFRNMADSSMLDLLDYYRNKTGEDYFHLSPGKAKHISPAQDILAHRFNLNNEVHCLPENFDWQQNPSTDLEWLILLHKFYYLKDLACAYDFSRDEQYARKWVELIDNWISQVPDGFIDSQVTGRRLQQWLLSYRYFVGKCKSPSVTPAFFARFLLSVDSQTRYLCANLTPEGNHRTLELYAIFVVGITFPELEGGGYFIDFAKTRLAENIQHDLLPDGVHRELSTDYHHTVLKNYLRFRELAQINQINLPAECDRLLYKALEFSSYVHKPDGFIPAINDGDCNSYLALLRKAHRLFPDQQHLYITSSGKEGIAPPQRSRLFAESGYCILRSDWTHEPYEESHYLFFDCACLGDGSHGHYDALNFEAAAFGQSLIVDPGRYTYSESGHPDNFNWRHYFKGTASHNTVVVDGLDQIAYQCEKPVDPKPVVHLDHFISRPGFDWIQGRVKSHRYPVIHERGIFFLHNEYWIVLDRLLADDEHHYDVYFHLSERAQNYVESIGSEQCFCIKSPNLMLVQPHQDGVSLQIEQGFVSPEYGIKHPAPVVRFNAMKESSMTFQTLLLPFKTYEPDVNICRIQVGHAGKTGIQNETSALEISIKIGQIQYTDVLYINYLDNNSRHVFADVECSARMLFLRRDKTGQIVNIQAEGLTFLAIKGKETDVKWFM